MKKHSITVLITLLLTFNFVGCENDDVVFDPVPATPQGVFSITGDNAVYLFWNSPYERDIAGFIIWRSFDPVDNYIEIGRVDAVDNPNLDLLIYEFVDNTVGNGNTYYYAVSAFDFAGQISDLSAEDVFDTPRPEGEIALFDFLADSTVSGFDLSNATVVQYNSVAADVYVDRVDGIFYLNAVDIDTDLQDMGYTDSFDDIGWAPPTGWSENGWTELILRHTYVIWTRDLHFAKMRVLSFNSNSVMFQWAFQTDQNNQELKPALSASVKPTHGPDYLRRDAGNSVSQ